MNLKCRYRKKSKAHQKGKIEIESIVQNRGISERVHTPWPACHCHLGYFISSRVFASHQRQVESPKRIIKENTSVLPSLTTSQDQMRCVILRLSYTSCDLCFFFQGLCLLLLLLAEDSSSTDLCTPFVHFSSKFGRRCSDETRGTSFTMSGGRSQPE